MNSDYGLRGQSKSRNVISIITISNVELRSEKVVCETKWERMTQIIIGFIV